MDYAEREYVGKTDSELVKTARSYWYVIDWHRCVSSGEVHDCVAIEAVLVSRGYDIGDLHKKWRAEEAVRVKATADAMIAEGEPLAGIVRAAITEASDKETGEVDWVMLDGALMDVTEEGTGVDDATLNRHGLGRNMEYWARKEVAAVLGTCDHFVAAKIVQIAARTVTPCIGGPAVHWVQVLKKLRTLEHWANMQELRDSVFERRRALAEYLEQQPVTSRTEAALDAYLQSQAALDAYLESRAALDACLASRLASQAGDD